MSGRVTEEHGTGRRRRSRRTLPAGVAGRQSEPKATFAGRRRDASLLECSGDFHRGLPVS